MPTMCQQLQREEDNLCAQRGLVQGQDTQTFSICFHQNLLDKWRKLQSSTVTNQKEVQVTDFTILQQPILTPFLHELQIQSTGNNPVVNALNQFLTSFLDHVRNSLSINSN